MQRRRIEIVLTYTLKHSHQIVEIVEIDFVVKPVMKVSKTLYDAGNSAKI